jgi:hypothetical protein
MIRSIPLVVALGLLAACDDSASTPAPPNAGFDAGDNTTSGGTSGGGTSGDPAPTPAPTGTGTTPPTPAPGPDVLALALPDFYSFVTPRGAGVGALENSGTSWFNVSATIDGPLTDLDRATLRVELNASAQGRKAGAIPVHLRSAVKSANGFQASTGFICVGERNGSSGRKYIVMLQSGANPQTGAPADVEGCSWFLVEWPGPGPKRYRPMVFWKGQEAYISAIESDASSGYRVVVGERETNGVAFHLLSPDHAGPLPK